MQVEQESKAITNVTSKDKLNDLLNLVYKFFTTRAESKLRLTDLQTLVKLKFADDGRVTEWREGSIKGRGVFPDLSKALENDTRFMKTSIGANEVYYELAPKEKAKLT